MIGIFSIWITRMIVPSTNAPDAITIAGKRIKRSSAMSPAISSVSRSGVQPPSGGTKLAMSSTAATKPSGSSSANGRCGARSVGASARQMDGGAIHRSASAATTAAPTFARV
jgi:hypothetical protein